MVASWLYKLARFWRPRAASRTRQARRAEATLDLARATRLYLQAGASEEALRVLLARADSALDAHERLKLLSLARQLSSGTAQAELVRRHAVLKLELVKRRALLLTASELNQLGHELATSGEHQMAADAFGLSGDLDAQTDELVEAGAIEQLESVFEAHERRDALSRARQRILERARDLYRMGQRRAALELCHEKLGASEPRLSELSRRIQSERAGETPVHLEFDGSVERFVLGERVTLGRSGSSLVVPSPAVSRIHLAIERRDGEPTIVDVSKNGTTLGGVPLAAALPVREPLELCLGGEVFVRFEPDARFGLRVSLLDQTVLLPLAALVLDVGAISVGPGGWLELDPGPRVFLREWEVLGRVQLCRGDEFRLERGGAVVLRVLE
jgi:tetratricopeptide (TPR) repeat protein